MWQATFTQIASSLPLGWSHYVELLTLEDPPERSFYEIEAASNQWSVRELQRQIASSSCYAELRIRGRTGYSSEKPGPGNAEQSCTQ